MRRVVEQRAQGIPCQPRPWGMFGVRTIKALRSASSMVAADVTSANGVLYTTRSQHTEVE